MFERLYEITATDGATDTVCPALVVQGVMAKCGTYGVVRLYVGSAEAGLIACAPDEIEEAADDAIAAVMSSLASAHGPRRRA